MFHLFLNVLDLKNLLFEQLKKKQIELEKAKLVCHFEIINYNNDSSGDTYNY